MSDDGIWRPRVEPRAVLLAQMAATIASQLNTPLTLAEMRQQAVDAVKQAEIILDYAERHDAGRFIGASTQEQQP